MSETIVTDAGYELTIYDGWDCDGELNLAIELQDQDVNLYLSRAQVIRLRNTLSIELGE